MTGRLFIILIEFEWLHNPMPVAAAPSAVAKAAQWGNLLANGGFVVAEFPRRSTRSESISKVV